MVTDDAEADPVARFAARLRELRITAGEPSYRTLAARSGYGRATVHEALAGRRLPTLELTLAVVESLGGDPAEWRTRWVATRTATSGGGPPLPAPQPTPAPHPIPRQGPATGWLADHPAPRPVSPDASSDGSPAGHPAADAVASRAPTGGMPQVPRDHPSPADPAPAVEPAPVGPRRRRRLALAGAAAGTAALIGAGLFLHAQSPPDPTSGCQVIPRYRLIDDGDLLAPAADAIIGSVRDGDLVDVLDRADPVHPYRFRVLVERTGQVGTVDASKLTRSGTRCVRLPG